MMRSLYSGVSGLKNHQTRMDVVGNNISNVNTTGFKSSRVTFSDTLNQTLSGASAPTENRGGTNPKQIGLGSATSSIDTLFTDGSVQSTGVNTDLCLSGNGLFVVKEGNSVYYTRNGNFKFDAQGYYVNTDGMKVQGWMADDAGNLNTTGATGYIQIPAGKTMAATSTTVETYTSNLNSATTGYTIGSVLVNYADGTSETVTNYKASKENVNTITLALSSGENITLDETAGFSFKAGEAVAGKTLYTSAIQSVKANATGGVANLKLGKGTAVNKINSADSYTLAGPLKEGSFTVGGKYTLSGKITEVTATGTGTGDVKIKVDIGNGTEITFEVPPPATGTYAVGDAYSVSLPIESFDVKTGAEVVTANGKTAVSDKDFAVNTANQLYERKGTANDGNINAISTKSKTIYKNNGKEVSTTNITTTDGQVLSGLIGKDYASNDIFYPSATTTATVYDSLGNAHSIQVLLTKTGENTWELALAGGGDSVTFDEPDGTTTTVSLTKTDLKFDQNGGYVSGSGSLECVYSNGASIQNVALNLAGLTQYSGSTTAFASNDGNAAGTLKSVSIDSAGVITGTYTNGINRQEGQVAVAQFNNAAGLTKTGNSLYTESNNSGTPNVGTVNGLGCAVTPSALEMSNVDMASELTDMIVTQRGYQSNSKIITVSDELLETLINMKR